MPSPAENQPEWQESAAPQKTKGIRPWIVVLSAVLVAGSIGVGAFFFLGRKGAEDPALASSFAHMPQTGRVVAVPTVGADLELVPLGTKAEASWHLDDQSLIGLQTTAGYSIASVNLDDSSALPQWVLPIPVSPAACALDSVTLKCGENLKYDLSSGMPEREGEPTSPQQAAGDLGRGPGETSDEPSSSSPIMKNVGPEATEDVPYGVNGDGLVNRKGTVLETPEPLPTDPQFWALEVHEGWWILSDGTMFIGVKANEVLWQRTLPEGSAALNGFHDGTPTWHLSGDVLLVATPSAILAIDAATGADVWVVEVAVDSWSADENALVVTTEDGLAVLPFPDTGPQSEEENEDQETVELGVPQDLEAPSFQDFQNASLDVPDACAAASGIGPVATFEDGITDPEGETPIAMLAFTQVIAEGQMYSVILFDCDAYSDAGVPVMAAYDEAKGLLGLAC